MHLLQSLILVAKRGICNIRLKHHAHVSAFVAQKHVHEVTFAI